jgi:hypothetical protein
MKASSRALAFCLAVAMSGCAAIRAESAGDGIFDLGDGKHMIKLTAITMGLSADDMKAQARRDAESFCKRQGKRFRPLEDRSPAAVPAVAQIVFECAGQDRALLWIYTA